MEKVHLELEELKAIHEEKQSQEMGRNFKWSGLKPFPPSYVCPSISIYLSVCLSFSLCLSQLVWDGLVSLPTKRVLTNRWSNYFFNIILTVFEICPRLHGKWMAELGPNQLWLLTSPDFQTSSFILCVSSNFVWWKFPNVQKTWKIKKKQAAVYLPPRFYNTIYISLYLLYHISSHYSIRT